MFQINNYKNYIFDCDGVILKSNAIKTNAFKHTLNEFNKNNEDIKICTPYHLRALKHEIWHHQIWICHFFKHVKYNQFISDEDQKLKI